MAYNFSKLLQKCIPVIYLSKVMIKDITSMSGKKKALFSVNLVGLPGRLPQTHFHIHIFTCMAETQCIPLHCNLHTLRGSLHVCLHYDPHHSSNVYPLYKPSAAHTIPTRTLVTGGKGKCLCHCF